MNTLPTLRPQPPTAADRIWALIPWPVRQAIKYRNRSPFELPDGSKGLFGLVGPSTACLGLAIYYDRRGTLWAELHRLLCTKGLGSKELAKESVSDLYLTLLKWAVDYELST